jgi:ElaA protein
VPATSIDGVRVANFTDLDATTLYELLRLRVDVFVVEQRCPYPELDGRDTEPATRHLWLPDPERGGSPVAYLRLLAEPDQAVRIGRVAVRDGHCVIYNPRYELHS